MGFQYLRDVVTLELDSDKCTLCGMCTKVCVHGVLAIDGNGIEILDRDACMECGACAMNCPAEAVKVRPGVGCAWAIFAQWFRRSSDSGEEGDIQCDCS
jgi:MinD superfamily P-loop ATPase